MEPIPDYADLMTLEDFTEYVRDGCFIEYDGDGYYATATEESQINVWNEPPPDWATHVTWYNK